MHRTLRSNSVTSVDDTLLDRKPIDTDILLDISDKLSVVCDRLSNITEQLTVLNDNMGHLSGDVNQQNSSTRDIAKVFEGTVKAMKQDICKEVKELTQEIRKIPENDMQAHNSNNNGVTANDTASTNNQQEIQNEALRKRNEIRNWNAKLKVRKWNYWDSLRCEKSAQKYQEWLGQEVKFIPRKYRPSTYNGEPEAEKKAKRELAYYKMNTEIKILQSKHKRFRDKYQLIDLEMHDIISRITPKTVSEEVSTMWITAYTSEEEKSNAIWENKEKELDLLPQKDLEHTDNNAENNRNENGQNMTRPTGIRYQGGQKGQWNSRQRNTYGAQYQQQSGYKTRTQYTQQGNIQRTITNNTNKNQHFLEDNPNSIEPW